MHKLRTIKYGGMMLTRDEKRAVNRVINRNWWPLASEGSKFEQEAAQYLGVKHGVVANSGSSAGLLALSALELEKGSEVIIPATTFPTIFNIIIQCGLIPVVVDTKPGSYNIDVDKLESAISDKTKAIIAVHAVGNPCDMPRIMDIANRHNLSVLEDDCDGWGGSLNGKKLGTFGHVSFTSFHAAHIVSMGQGGGVFTNDENIARNARMYRDWGRQSDIERRTNDGKWPSLPDDYDMRFIYEKLGYNLSPLELQAAMGREQLKKTEKIKRLRKEHFDYLYWSLWKHQDLMMPSYLEGAAPSWFSFPLSTTGERGPLVKHLEENGIETRSMFAGNILKHPGYANVPHRIGNELIGADWILKHSFWVSCHPSLTHQDLRYMLDVFDEYYALSA